MLKTGTAMNEKVAYWIEMSDYDLETASAIFLEKTKDLQKWIKNKL